MSAKGNVDTKLDTVLLSNLIVYANKYTQEVDEKADQIIMICRKMQDEESLKGGDGDEFLQGFNSVAVGMRKIRSSTKKISDVLNNKLAVALGLKRGTTSGAATEAAKKAASKAGVLKKE